MIRLAQLLLVLSAVGLWIASRLTWVTIRSSDGLGQPKTAALSGATWSNALLPLAVLLLAAAVAGLAVRGWLLRGVAVLIAAVSLALGYLGVSLMQMPDISVRGADLAQVPVVSLVGSERHLGGAAITIVAAVGALLAGGGAADARRTRRPSDREIRDAGGAPIGRAYRRRCRGVSERACGTRSMRAVIPPRPPTNRRPRVGDGRRARGGYPSRDISLQRQKGSGCHEFGNRARLHHRGSPGRRRRS